MKTIDENPIKDTSDLNSTKSYDLVGGNQEWKPIINNVGQTVDHHTPACGEDPVDLAYELKKNLSLKILE